MRAVRLPALAQALAADEEPAVIFPVPPHPGSPGRKRMIMTEPYWTDGQVALYHGDCREVLEWLAADVLVTDPPYGIGWNQHGSVPSQHNQARHEGITGDENTGLRDTVLSAWGSARPALSFGSLRVPYPAGWKRMLIFHKPLRAGMFGSRLPWFANWEPIFALGTWPDQTPTLDAVISTQAPSASGYSGYATRYEHPHAKPVDVMETLIAACPPGVIADPFTGSGSTLVAARNLGRQAIGVEINERYCELATRRLAQGILGAS